MSDLNQVVLMGRLGDDPAIDYLQSGTAKAKLSLAVNRNYGDKKRTDWITVIYYGPRAEAIEKYLHKGMPVVVIGAVVTDSWETDDGQKRKLTYVLGREFHFVPGNGNGNGDGETSSKGKSNTSKGKPKSTKKKEDFEVGDLDFEDEDEDEEDDEDMF